MAVSVLCIVSFPCCERGHLPNWFPVLIRGHLPGGIHYSLFIIRHSLFTLMSRGLLRLIVLSGCMIWLGAGREIGGDNPGEQGDAPQAAYSPYPPRFSPPSPRFPDPLTPLGRTAYLCLFGVFSLADRSVYAL